MNSQDAATLKALGDGVIEAGQRAEAKWGVGRLPLLVPVEWREKFERQLVAHTEALEACYAGDDGFPLPTHLIDAVRVSADATGRAWGKLDRLAAEAGADPLRADVWEVARADGRIVAIVPTVADAHQVIAEGRHVDCYTLDEIVNVLDALPAAVTAAKREWPGARVLPQRGQGRSRVSRDDEIPF